MTQNTDHIDNQMDSQNTDQTDSSDEADEGGETEYDVPLEDTEDSSSGDTYQPISHLSALHDIPTGCFVSQDEFPEAVEKLVEPTGPHNSYFKDDCLWELEIGEYAGYTVDSGSPDRIQVGEGGVTFPHYRRRDRDRDSDTAEVTRLTSSETGDHCVKVPTKAVQFVEGLSEPLAGSEHGDGDRDRQSVWVSTQNLKTVFATLRENQYTVIVPWGVELTSIADTCDRLNPPVTRILEER